MISSIDSVYLIYVLQKHFLSLEKIATKIPRPKIPPTGESLSIRQRAPALLLKKLDEFGEKANKVWVNGQESENNDNITKLWKKPIINFTGQLPLHRQDIQNSSTKDILVYLFSSSVS